MWPYEYGNEAVTMSEICFAGREDLFDAMCLPHRQLIVYAHSCRVLASRVQLPLMLAWAISIHKVRIVPSVVYLSNNYAPAIFVDQLLPSKRRSVAVVSI